MTPQLLLGLAVAPIAVSVIVVFLREPMRLALPAYAAVIPFGGLLSVGSSRFASLSSLVGIVLGAGLVLQLALPSGTRTRLSPTIPIWLLLLGLAGATTLWSVAPGTSANSFIVLGSLVIVYVLVAISPVDRDLLRRLENGLILGGLAAVGYGLFQLLVLGGFPNDPVIPGAPPEGRFGNGLLGPNNQAVALMLPLLISLTRAVTIPDRSTRLRYAAMAALLLGGVLMTGSRGGILAATVAVLAMLVATPRGRGRLLVYTVIGLVLAGYVWVFHPFGLAERSAETVTSSSGRTDIWQVGLAACPQYCPFGSGWGTFPDVYADTQATVAGARVLLGGGTDEPHNVWLLLGIELGLLGLILLVAGLLVSAFEAVRLPEDLRGVPLAALVATVFAASFLSNLEFKFFWMALILVVLSRNLAVSEAREARGSPDEQQLSGQRG